MTAINIDYDDKQVQDALNRLIHTGQDLSPVMAGLAGHLEASTQKMRGASSQSILSAAIMSGGHISMAPIIQR